MARNVLKRAVALQVPGLVLEFELLPAMTEQPEWAAELTALLHRHLRAASENSGLRCAMRVTPTDIRDQGKHALLRTGPAWEKLRRSFELCWDAGADILSIESVGGKAARSLVAFEHGAIGPSKDCAYEGPVIKAITGCPIAMEGKSATCAHFSPLGNIASATCDLWSNESVQNVRLLSGNAPEAYAETLAYDCRVMNVATARNQALTLRDWLTESDEWLSPQAAILSPRAVCRIAEAIVSAPDTYRRTVAAGQTAVAILREGQAAGTLKLAPKERNWLDRIEKELQSSPASEDELLGPMSETYGEIFLASSSGL